MASGPRIAFVNKMDILGANFDNTVHEIVTKLGKNPVVVERPIGKEDYFKGIVDLFEMKAYIYNDYEGRMRTCPHRDGGEDRRVR